MGFMWILIPLAGIALAGFSEWLKFKRQTASLDQSAALLTDEVEVLRGELAELREERVKLVQRIQNLETIVTSEAWEALGSDPELARSKLLDLPESQADDQTRADRIARRLRG